MESGVCMDGDGDGFGDFGGFSSFPAPSSGVKPPRSSSHSTDQAAGSRFNQRVERSQPTSAAKPEFSQCQFGVKAKHREVKPPSHFTNGFPESDRSPERPGTRTASVVGDARSCSEETGFADFNAFTEQGVQPWCCGFHPGPWDGSADGTSSAGAYDEQRRSGQEEIPDSEPGSRTASAKKDIRTEVEHCERRGAMPFRPSQDSQPQVPTAGGALEPKEPKEPHPTGDEQGGSQRKRRPSLHLQANTTQSPEMEGEGGRGETGASSSPPSVSTSPGESASEDFASFCDVVSPQGHLEDIEASIPSLVEDEVKMDGADHVDDDDDDDEGDSPSRSKAGTSPHHLNHSDSVLQETEAESVKRETGTDLRARVQGREDSGSELPREQDRVQTGSSGAGDQGLGGLPPSDSFADFCSAPTEGDWGEVLYQEAPTGGKTWTQSKEDEGDARTGRNAEDERERWGGDWSCSRKNSQTSLSNRVQGVFQACFPEVEVPAGEDGEEDVEEVPSLRVLLQAQDLHPEHWGDGPCPRKHGVLWAAWIQPHYAVGLNFQWEGSHIHRILLRCLGVDTSNIEARSSSQPRSSSSSSSSSSSRGLSVSQDGGPLLNLDFFGPADESGSSRSSRSNSPPPGLERELHELTVQMETSVSSSQLDDAVNRLLSTATLTSAPVRKPACDELSPEAGKLICDLPNLTFMWAKFLMFPSVLTPNAGAPRTLH